MGNPGEQFYGAAAVRELERRAAAAGIPGAELMRRAGAAAFRELLRRWPRASRIAVLCGPGNNGGDGRIVAQLAREAGLTVTDDPAGCDVVVDGLLGLGLSRPPEGALRQAIDAIAAARAAGAGVLALDLPSGLQADRGCVLGVAVQADLTVSFLAAKPGLVTGAGPDHCGTLVIDRLGVPDELFEGLPPAAHRLDARRLAGLLPPRKRGAHKGQLGHVLVVGGDAGTMGAALLAARAALRSGAGLVSVATRAAHCAAITAAQPELMCHAVESAGDLRRLLGRSDVIAVGPGLGQDVWGRALLAEVLTADKPLILDADALNLLALEPATNADWILTPHPGEAGRLLGRSASAVQADRFAAVRELQQRYGGIAVLKGAGTLVAGQEIALCPHGNPGMAAGGTGDALCGVIAALRAQGLGAEDAACAGVTAHALAGDRAALAGERGLLASDLTAQLRAILNP